MEFSEAQSDWRIIPDWARFLLEFGYLWLHQRGNSRRIALISMPTDSAAAGLIALGAMRKCLEFDEANDVDAHYHRLIALARTPHADIVLRHTRFPGTYALDSVDSSENLWVKKLNSKSPMRRGVPRSKASEWRIVGEAPVVILNGRQVTNSQFYSHLVATGNEIKLSNLSESYSNVCLAGRAGGEIPTKDRIADIKFRENGLETDLSQLLTIQRWMPGTISRVIFYNSRTEEFDRLVGTPQVVIADGDTAFLKVLGRTDFENSDIVGVIHRTMEREKLEALSSKLISLGQWYETRTQLLDSFPSRPSGIAVTILEKRT